MDLPNGNGRLSTRGIVYNSELKKGIKCYADVDFADGWEKWDADNEYNFMYCTGYVITYALFPVWWWSKLQTDT